eukprot:TRINITY_DN12375_c0_g1_i1.p1 TRINITY_DN12375_c0_g1~~TRINITY_DN12375_c0_g1_i1.p1  ORF type:complete len:158 (-),score=33.88 TRINITY_DN12375_c0_g1_i1:357-830(-)
MNTSSTNKTHKYMNNKYISLSDPHLSLGLKYFFPKDVAPFADNNDKYDHQPTAHMMGLFQDLLAISHPHLCVYIDLIKGKHGRLHIVSEHYRSSLRKALSHSSDFNKNITEKEEEIRKIMIDILSSLVFLHKHNIIFTHISPDFSVFDGKGTVKLAV